MHQHRIERVLVVDDEFQLHGLITVKDILKATEHPNASKDATGRLRAGCCCRRGHRYGERVGLLAEAGVDVIVVDTVTGHCKACWIACNGSQRTHPNVQVIRRRCSWLMRPALAGYHALTA